MNRFLGFAAVVCAAMAAGSAEGAVLAGGVYEDKPALAVRANFTPIANAAVTLFRDGGDGAPGADDRAVATLRTDASGLYVFRDVDAGDYWVAVDSRTLGGENTWAEQTFGPAGSLCAQPDGSTRSNAFEGACIGGRTAGADNATSAATAEHIARVTLREPATNVDFAFSFDLVTATADGPHMQGSLRQFIDNANARPGADAMRFVPIARAPEQRQPIVGVPARWWMITLATPLPELRDDDTTIDGTAYNFLSPASRSNVHPGRVGESPTIRVEERQVPRIENPELELAMTGEEGFACTGRCTVRSLAMHGAATAIALRADGRVEHVLIGAAPDTEPQAVGQVGLQIERGVTIARYVLITSQARGGIVVAPQARLDAERLDITRSGSPQTGGGLVLLSDGSSVRSSLIAANPGVGILIGSNQGAANGNTIDGCTISGNQAGVVLWAGSSRNAITRNDIMWNRLGGVSVAPYQQAAPPRENRVSANRFDENGLRPIVLDLGASDPDMLAQAGTCDRIATSANSGIAPPRITGVRIVAEGATERVVVSGHACPGEIVELYQSFVTSGVQNKQAELPRIRGTRRADETVTADRRPLGMPSIGEFNYLGATNTTPEGNFEASFPLAVLVPTAESVVTRDEEHDVWAHDVVRGGSASDRAFSALAIDSSGNTSEMSVRRKVDQTDKEKAEK
ncbi:MAG TPA: right-handed parallel beta-helix repeat-containing protein [Thermoanaerobaculia bacterium]|jgi:parallel beta-helix repeat protein